MKYHSVDEIKELRKQVDALIQAVNAGGTHNESEVFQQGADVALHGTAHYQAHLKLIEAKMWLGKMLEGIGIRFRRN
jgi:hypothetical protein